MMKTFEQIEKINFNDYAFFKGVSTTDAKYEIAEKIFPLDWMEKENTDKYFTKSGTPKVSVKDYEDKELFDFTMISNSHLDGKCQMKYLCEYYNKGISLSKLNEYAQSASLIKAMKFSGKNSIVNEILNPEQILKLQKSWLFANCYSKNRYSDKAVVFIKSSDWSLSFLQEKGISLNTIQDQIDKYELRKNPEPEVNTIFN